jgi:glycerol-1-phosphate dehydrogenase [NAD(P)+]
MMAYLHKANWERIKDTLKKLGAPTNAHELSVENEDIVKALEMAMSMRPERYTVLDRKKPNRKACRKLAKKTKVMQ